MQRGRNRADAQTAWWRPGSAGSHPRKPHDQQAAAAPARAALADISGTRPSGPPTRDRHRKVRSTATPQAATKRDCPSSIKSPRSRSHDPRQLSPEGPDRFAKDHDWGGLLLWSRAAMLRGARAWGSVAPTGQMQRRRLNQS
jgi:hypothetical protein